MRASLLILSFFAGFSLFAARIETHELTYAIGDKQFKGWVAKPARTDSSTVTVMVVHEWWGLDEYPKMRARQLASEGYIAFCVDMFGDGKIAADPKEAQALAGEVYSDEKVLLERFMAAYKAITAEKYVNAERMAAIGYCFGGSVVLNAAKLGVPLDAVVSFHGGLQGPPANAQTMRAAVLVCNGAADKMVSEKDKQQFKDDLVSKEKDLTFIEYKNATHAFTNPKATENGKKFNMPIAYNKAADKKSWKDSQAFLKEKVK
jgi:dienelactone hydrolase